MPQWRYQCINENKIITFAVNKNYCIKTANNHSLLTRSKILFLSKEHICEVLAEMGKLLYSKKITVNLNKGLAL